MANQTRPDWLLPLLLIVGALVTGLAGWGIFRAVGDAPSQETSLLGQVERYTACLSEHGADVPLVETRSDGGFVVVVPGAVFDGSFDLGAFADARAACREFEPNPLDLLLAAGLDPAAILALLEGGSDHGYHEGSAPGSATDLTELCERLEAGEIEDPGGVLGEICASVGG